jgi:hypothetical protein
VTVPPVRSRVSAQVASLRCPILCASASSITTWLRDCTDVPRTMTVQAYDEDVTKLVGLAVTALIFALPVSAETTKARVTGFFTNMQYIAEAGDMVGMEVWIVYARGGHWATVQLAEGAPDRPVVVPVEVSDRRISFALPGPSGDSSNTSNTTPLKFVGEVTKAGLTGTFVHDRVVLKRGRTYWH